MIKNCNRCQGPVEPITRLGEVRFYLCRACKIPYDASGGTIINLNSLQSNFNPLKDARDTIKIAAPGATPVAKTAMEAAAIQGYLEAYMAGIKDGILLIFTTYLSQRVSG